MSAAPLALRKLRCLFGVRDDLHEFAEHTLNTLSIGALNGSCGWCKDFGGIRAAVVHRCGSYQVELVIAQPGLVVPTHTHIGTDSIEYPIAGAVRLTVDGRELFGHLDDERFFSTVKGSAVRIAHDAPHSARTHRTLGAMFLSVQRWTAAPGYLGDNYQGRGMSAQHDALLRAAH